MKGVTASSADIVGSKESALGMIGDGCGCQDIVEPKESTLGMTGDRCGCQEEVDGNGVAGSVWVERNGVDGVRGEGWRWAAGVVFAKTRGQLLTRPEGLLRTVGRTSLNELCVLVRFKVLDEQKNN